MTTLSKASLADLATGNSKLLVIPQLDVLTAGCFDTAQALYTTKDSLKVTEAAPTQNEVTLDQGNGMHLNNTYTNGKVSIAGSLPYSAAELYDMIYTEITGGSTAKGALSSITVDSKIYNSMKAYSFNKKIVPSTIFISSQSGKTAIIFMHVDFFGVQNIENVNTKNWTIDFTGNVNTFDAGDFVVLKQIATT